MENGMFRLNEAQPVRRRIWVDGSKILEVLLLRFLTMLNPA